MISLDPHPHRIPRNARDNCVVLVCIFPTIPVESTLLASVLLSQLDDHKAQAMPNTSTDAGTEYPKCKGEGKGRGERAGAHLHHALELGVLNETVGVGVDGADHLLDLLTRLVSEAKTLHREGHLLGVNGTRAICVEEVEGLLDLLVGEGGHFR